LRLLTRVLTVVNFVFALRRFAAGLGFRNGVGYGVVKKPLGEEGLFGVEKALRPVLLPNVE
jgi:hypothetical protein